MPIRNFSYLFLLFLLVSYNPIYIYTCLISQFQTGGLIRTAMAITSILLFFLTYLNQIKLNKKIYLIDIEFIPISMFILMAVNFLTLFISINISNLEIVGTDFFPIFMLTASFITFTLIIQMKKNNFYLLYYSIIIWALIIVYFDIIHIIMSQLLNYDYA